MTKSEHAEVVRLSESVTIIRGDCLECLPIEADAVITDPPYGMAFQSNRRRKQYDKIIGDKTDDHLTNICQLSAKHSKYIFCRWDNIAFLPKPKSLITWVKNNRSMGDLEHEHGRQTECIAFYPGSDHQWPGKRPADVVFAPRTGNDFHPTEKPVALMETIVGWTKGTVLDPYMGSGSTGVACIRTQRKFVGIEWDPIHFATARRRLEDELRQGWLPLSYETEALSQPELALESTTPIKQGEDA